MNYIIVNFKLAVVKTFKVKPIDIKIEIMGAGICIAIFLFFSYCVGIQIVRIYA